MLCLTFKTWSIYSKISFLPIIWYCTSEFQSIIASWYNQPSKNVNHTTAILLAIYIEQSTKDSWQSWEQPLRCNFGILYQTKNTLLTLTPDCQIVLSKLTNRVKAIICNPLLNFKQFILLTYKPLILLHLCWNLCHKITDYTLTKKQDNHLLWPRYNKELWKQQDVPIKVISHHLQWRQISS